MLEELRNKLSLLHAELYSSNLVAWTGGNISEKDEETQLVAIKPSGVKYSELSPDSIVIVDLEGLDIGASIKISSIKLNDEATFEMLSNGKTCLLYTSDAADE